MEKRSKAFIYDDVLMTALALVSAAMLAIEVSGNLAPTQVTLFDGIDLLIALVFLTEFLINFFKAKDKTSFFGSNWWELLAAVPVTTHLTQGLRVIKLLRLVRLVRLDQGLEAIKSKSFLKRFIIGTRFISILTVWSIIIFSSTIIFYSLEHGVNPNLHSLFDSLWWTIVTVTTVGYGDILPITIAGKILAMAVMICGIGITGIFAGLVASFFIKENRS